MYVSFSKEMKHVWIYALSIAAKLRLVADCHVLQSIAVDKSEYPPGGYLVPKELFEQALDVIIPELKGEGDKFDRLNKIWRLDSQVNPLLYPGPNAVNYGQRQAFRRALRLLVDAIARKKGAVRRGPMQGLGTPSSAFNTWLQYLRWGTTALECWCFRMRKSLQAELILATWGWWELKSLR